MMNLFIIFALILSVVGLVTNVQQGNVGWSLVMVFCILLNSFNLINNNGGF
jgi:hypothetical protein